MHTRVTCCGRTLVPGGLVKTYTKRTFTVVAKPQRSSQVGYSTVYPSTVCHTMSRYSAHTCSRVNRNHAVGTHSSPHLKGTRRVPARFTAPSTHSVQRHLKAQVCRIRALVLQIFRSPDRTVNTPDVHAKGIPSTSTGGSTRRRLYTSAQSCASRILRDLPE